MKTRFSCETESACDKIIYLRKSMLFIQMQLTQGWNLHMAKGFGAKSKSCFPI
jgi:hypothetical protein